MRVGYIALLCGISPDESRQFSALEEKTAMGYRKPEFPFIPVTCNHAGMEWINPEKRRYYRATVQHDLLGELVVVRDYGSLDTARGGRKLDIAANQQDADRLMRVISKTRIRRGYLPTPCSPLFPECVSRLPETTV